MKKRWLLASLALILVISIALISCDNENNAPSSTTTAATTATVTEATTAPTETPNSPEEPVKIEAPYEISDLSKITMCDISKGVSVDVSLNTKLSTLLSTVTYYNAKESRDESATAKYTLSFGEITLTVYSDSSIGFTGTSIYVDSNTGLWGILLTNAVHYGRENRADYFALRKSFYNSIVKEYESMK